MKAHKIFHQLIPVYLKKKKNSPSFVHFCSSFATLLTEANITQSCGLNVLNEPASPSRRLELVASGGLSGTDPDRVVLKEVVLTGSAVRVHKRTAIVRGMFFNPADVLYFRCVGIRTSGGRVGSIQEPVGTHGRMRCIFDNTIQQNETIYMRLYKRTFPKWCE